jgi:hypothetical protein
MGEAKRKLAKREEMLLSCTGLQTVGGRVEVRWKTEKRGHADGWQLGSGVLADTDN